MATHDDDVLSAAVPEPDAEPTPSELAHARRFADLVDKTLAGRTPPAIAADDRALLEVATVIRATRGEVGLAASRQHAVVEAALRQAIGTASTTGPVASLAQSRSTLRQRAPWLVAGASALAAAAAIAILWLRAPLHRGVPAEWTSRPADALVGPIARDHAGDASARIDAIFADRLDGFRARRLAQGGRR